MSERRLIDATALEEKAIYITGPKNSACHAVPLGLIQAAPTIDPETLRPVAHWEEIPGSYKCYISKDGSWCVPATRCSNPECREANPCSLKTPFCPMCGSRMEDVPYEREETH
jgi:hypothetical protein